MLAGLELKGFGVRETEAQSDMLRPGGRSGVLLALSGISDLAVET